MTRLSARVACLVAALALFGASARALAADDDAPVRGLVVQLRDAPAHGALVRDGARAQRLSAAAQSATLADAERARWHGVLARVPALRLASQAARGASARVLRFEQPLSRAQAQALAQQLAAQPEVAWAVPRTRERRLQANPPNDPLFPGFGQQWWLQPNGGSDGLPIDQRLRGVPGFQTAWTQLGTGSAAGVVAVLDSGITPHPELAGRVLPGYDLVSDSTFSNDGDGRDADPADPGDWVDATDLQRSDYRELACETESSSWHGTAIAGMLSALTNNGQGPAGMNWAASVVPVRVAAKCGADVDDIVDGLRWAAGLEVCRRSDDDGTCLDMAPRNPNPVRVINLSFGGSGSCDPYQGTIDELKALGVVIVAAAGNEHAQPARPAKCPGVVGVVSVNRDGFKSNYSNFGSELTASGIATVGGDDADGRWTSMADSGLLTLGNSGLTAPGQPTDNARYWGTSFSTPLVAGALGLMLSLNPQLTHDQLVAGLRASARPHVTSTLAGVAACSAANPGRCLCTEQTCGKGLLDVEQAMRYALNPAAYVAPARTPALVNAADLAAAAAAGADRVPNPATPPPGNGGGGGGASSLGWLLALVLATLLLGRAGASGRRRR
jgi:serine protease